MRKVRTVAMTLAFSVFVTVWPASAKPAKAIHCGVSECAVGTRVTSYASADDPFFACPTAELSDYISTVHGFVEMSYHATGRFPSVSPVTGEPELDAVADAMIRRHRTAARVATFDQAVAMCKKGRHRQRLIIAKSPTASMSALVFEQGKPSDTFWVPKANLDVAR